MALICRYCQRDAIYVPLRVSDRRTFEVHYCFDCNAEYVDYGSNNGLAIHLYTKFNDKMYRWSITEHEKGSAGYLWYVGEPGEPGVRPNRKLKLLKHFNEPHTIIPSNVESKIRFMLLFL